MLRALSFKEIKIKFVALIACFLLSGCSVVSIEDYRNSETHEIREQIIYGGDVDPVNGEVILVPNFRTFTSSFPVRSSSLYIVSNKETKVFVKGAKLSDSEKSLIKSVDLNKSYTLSRKLRDTDLHIENIPLFGDGITEYPHFKGAKHLDLLVQVSVNGGSMKEYSFPLELVVYKDIAWPT